MLLAGCVKQVLISEHSGLVILLVRLLLSWRKKIDRHKFAKLNAVGVVSIGTNPTFKVNFTPLEYVPTMSKRFHFFGSRFHKTCTQTGSLPPETKCDIA